MAQKNLLFTWRPESFNTALEQLNLVDLRTELAKRRSLSGSLLIWEKSARDETWWLADLKYDKIYYLDRNSDTEIAVSEEVQDLVRWSKPDLKQKVYATSEGFIDWLRLFTPEESDLEGLKRTDLSDRELDFEIVHDDLLAAYELLREVLTSPHESFIGIANESIQQIGASLEELYEITNTIWSVSSSTSEDAHQEALRQIFRFCDSVKEQLGQTVTYLRARKAEQLDPQVAERLEIQVQNIADKALENFKEESNLSHESTKQDVGKVQQRLDKLTDRVEKELAQESVSRFKEIFAEQAKKYQRAAWVWLGVAGLLIIGLMTGIVFWGLLDVLQPAGTGWTEVLQNIFKKGSVLTLFYFALNRSLKNYTAQKHLEIVNRHRENALGTFTKFVSEAEESRETKDAVLLAATNAIFDANQTGYLSAKTKGTESVNPIQQVFGAMRGSSTRSED